MSFSAEIELSSEAQTLALGKRLANTLLAAPRDRAIVVHLSGDLGAGKTTLVRATLRACGISGAVKSPTYTLVEPYEVKSRPWYHLDLYRVGHPEELEFLGLTDWLADNAVLLVEWPEKGAGLLPEAQLALALTVISSRARGLRIEAESRSLLSSLVPRA